MKHLTLGLAVFVFAPLVLAAESGPTPAATEPAATAATSPAKAKAGKKRPRAGKQSLPSGDLRPCLELKTNEEVVKCADRR